MRITRSKQPLFSSCRPRTSRPLRFESLEDRRLLAVGGLADVDEIDALEDRKLLGKKGPPIDFGVLLASKQWLARISPRFHGTLATPSGR